MTADNPTDMGRHRADRQANGQIRKGRKSANRQTVRRTGMGRQRYQRVIEGQVSGDGNIETDRYTKWYRKKWAFIQADRPSTMGV